MNVISKKYSIIILLMGLLVALTNVGLIEPLYAQTNLQELNNRVTELERRLADAKARQERAYSVQMKLEEQEQKLSSLPDSVALPPCCSDPRLPLEAFRGEPDIPRFD